jgi:hypothetical protein
MRRRDWLTAGVSASAIWFANRGTLAAAPPKKEFWNSKEPTQWSAEEKERVLNQSPWAQSGFARMELENKLKEAAAAKRVSGGRGRLGDAVQTPNRPGENSVPIGEKPPPVPNMNPGEEVRFPVLARWETAGPVRFAGGPALPELGGDFYVIRLQGLPLMPPPKPAKPSRRKVVVTPDPATPPVNPNEGLLYDLKSGSRLERKDKAPIRCTNLFAGSGDEWNQVLLLFPRKPEEAIVLGDRFVTLESWFTPFHLSVKFSLKEMVYKGELAL